jgi:hypothetical protein
MRGRDINDARIGLRLSVTEFARLLQVGRSTVYRWEASRVAQIQPLYRTLVVQLVGLGTAREDDLYGQRIREALRLRGPLYGLHVVMVLVFDHCGGAYGRQNL